MSLRDDNEELKRDNLNINYNDLSNEERFLDRVIRSDEKGYIADEQTSNSTPTQKQMTREEIMNTVLQQVNTFKQDEEKEDLPSWYKEYKKQPIEVTKERVLKYIQAYRDLPNLIKFREQKLISGEAKPESKVIEPSKLDNLDFLKDNNIDKIEFFKSVDYKLNEMIFYHKNLKLQLEYLKSYMLMGYQTIILKHYYGFRDIDIQRVTNIKNVDYFEDIIINYLYEKLVEENKKECQK